MTETKVVGGSTVEITWTSTSTVVTQVQQTETVYTTSVATEYEKTDVYTTVCSNLTRVSNTKQVLTWIRSLAP